jgi:Stress responsive A/B Barrel Domain
MVKHIVFFKHARFDELVDELVARLRELEDDMDYIVDLEVGVDFLRSERSFDAALTVVLKCKDDLPRYAEDPAHMRVVEWIKANGFETKVVDYEV